MFFPELVKNYKDGDRILEIGPGATPHKVSTVFLELEYETEKELIAQSGHVGKLTTDKEIVYYQGGAFPFADLSFDYVICSHVLEHVPDLPFFLSELSRVAPKGYLEFPTIYYDYLHNIEEHLNMILFKDGILKWCKKNDTPIPELENFTNFFRELQHKGFRFNTEINQLWHQGFEWEGKLQSEQVDSWHELTYEKKLLKTLIPIPDSNQNGIGPLGVKASFKHFLSQLKNRIFRK